MRRARRHPLRALDDHGPRMTRRRWRSHESIAEDPVVLVLDPLSFDSTLTEHRERLLAGGEVLENFVDAPVVEGAPLIGVAVGVPSADRSVARGAAHPHFFCSISTLSSTSSARCQ